MLLTFFEREVPAGLREQAVGHSEIDQAAPARSIGKHVLRREDLRVRTAAGTSRGSKAGTIGGVLAGALVLTMALAGMWNGRLADLPRDAGPEHVATPEAAGDAVDDAVAAADLVEPVEAPIVVELTEPMDADDGYILHERHETPRGPVELRVKKRAGKMRHVDPATGLRVEAVIPEFQIEVYPIEE